MIVVVALGFVAVTAALLRSPFALTPGAILTVIAVIEYYIADPYRLLPRRSEEQKQNPQSPTQG
jgi:hypothetical protein